MIYEFEGYEDDHVTLACGDKVVVENVEGEVCACWLFSVGFVFTD